MSAEQFAYPRFWSTADELTEKIDSLLAAAGAARDTAAAASGEDAIRAFNDVLRLTDNALGWASVMFQLHPDEAVRTAAGACRERGAAFSSEVNLDHNLYASMAAVKDSGLECDEETERFLDKLLREFRRSGVAEDEATRTRLKAIRAAMVSLGQEFQARVREDTRRIHVSLESLAGLPEDWLSARTVVDGQVELTTEYPVYFPVQTYCADAAVREQLYREFTARGYPENKPVLEKLLTLRHEYASTLGFESWADYSAQDKMVGSASAISAFIDSLELIARPRMDADLAELLAAKQKDYPDATEFHAWDRFYYQRLVKEERCGLDTKAVRSFFPYKSVLDGVLTLMSGLFGVEFRASDAPVWHPSIRPYDLVEASDGTRLAHLYLDMHPRSGKYQHAAMFGVNTGVKDTQLPVATLVCNFPEPNGDNAALMEHTQVVTLFHELGHLLHHLLAHRSRYANLGGINVEWDFVEVPSQLLEEWAWDPDVLKRFALHVDTGEPISADTVAKMRAAEEIGRGANVMRQIFYTAYSYHLHATHPDKLDLEAETDRLYEAYSPFVRVEGDKLYANFGHLVGYSSMYYTYQWSLVIAKDVFSRFAGKLMDQEVAREYRRLVLEPGGMRDAAELVKSFLGRGYKLDAYRKWLMGAAA